ncbi:MAG: helix-turn-helix domain-containing protein [Methanomassiliicoccales archaeon]
MASSQVERGQCPIVAAIRVVGNESKLTVIRYLTKNGMGFNELKRISGMNAKTLSSALRSLEAEGIVNRQVVSTRPFKVSYTLTQKGLDLRPALEILGEWASRWLLNGTGEGISPQAQLNSSLQSD